MTGQYLNYLTNLITCLPVYLTNYLCGEADCIQAIE